VETNQGSSFRTIVLVAILLIALGWLVTVLMSANGRRAEAIHMSDCASNLRQIGLALEQYVTDSYNGAMPARTGNRDYSMDVIAALHADGQGLIGDLKVFECPSAPHPPTQPGSLPNTYIFFPSLADTSASNTVIAADRPGNHAEGANLLYKDVHVKFSRYPNDDVNLYAQWARAFEGGDLEAAQLGPEAWAQKKGLIP